MGATDVRLAGLEAQRHKLQADATDADGRCQGLRDQVSQGFWKEQKSCIGSEKLSMVANS
jgi:hypothetical protein